MKKESFAPFRKPNDNPVYIHAESNHPPHVTKHLPVSINKRLSQISSDEKAFDRAKGEYEKALQESKNPQKTKVWKEHCEIKEK